jgi:outer membrane PBP1 activator LpoA protein
LRRGLHRFSATSGSRQIAKIALFLPLNGQASIFGRTIQQGFEAATNGAPSVPLALPEFAPGPAPVQRDFRQPSDR